MEAITNAFNNILKPGAAVFMPVIIIIFVAIIKLFSNKSITWIEGIKSGLTLGVAFVGMGVVIGFMINIFNQPFTLIRKQLKFDTLDLGWSPNAALSWTWQFAFLLFPIQIFVNALFLRLNWTKTLNVDLWNVWNKVFTSLVTTYVLSGFIGTAGSVAIGLIVGLIMVCLELKNADLMYYRQNQILKIPNVVTPHSMFLEAPFIYQIDKLLQKIDFFKDKGEHKETKENKILVLLRDNMIIGFLLGVIISLCTIWFDLKDWDKYLLLPFQLSAALVLFPMVSRLFTKSLVPLGIAVQNIMTQRFNNREIHIGLDWPILAGRPNIWIVATILIPFEIGFAVIFSFLPNFHMVFPLGSLINVCLTPVLLVICNQNIKRMIVCGILMIPIYLLFAGVAAESVTSLAKNNMENLNFSDEVASKITNGELFISNSGFEAPSFRWGFSEGLLLFGGTVSFGAIFGFILLIGWIVAAVFYYIEMNNWNKEFKKNLASATSKVV